MNPESDIRSLDPFGDDEDTLDIHCRPALDEDLPQIAFLAAEMLKRVFGDIVGPVGEQPSDIILAALRGRLRHDCAWVMHEGETVIGIIDLETVETRRLNGPPITRVLASALDLTESIEQAGLLPLLVHEPADDEAHQALVALLPGSRGEGHGTLLLMHGAFWARAQGKDWITTWLPSDDPVLPVYERRGYFVEREVVARRAQGTETWLLLKRPISTKAHKMLRAGNGEKS